PASQGARARLAPDEGPGVSRAVEQRARRGRNFSPDQGGRRPALRQGAAGAPLTAVAERQQRARGRGAADVSASSPHKPRLIIGPGVSGSGRASAMRVLEDLGFYCVDNMPVALAESAMRLAVGRDPQLPGVALGIDARERLFFPQWPRVFNDLERAGFPPEVRFLRAADEVLVRRYSESRRPHPMAESGASVTDGIRNERLALAEMRERADRVIDTSALTVHELRELITAAMLGAASGSSMNIA